MPIQIDRVENKLFVIDVMNLGILLPCAQMQEVLAIRIRRLLSLRVGLLKARKNRRRGYNMRKVGRKGKKGRGRKFVGSVGLREDILEDRIALLSEEKNQNNEIDNILWYCDIRKALKINNSIIINIS